MKAYYYMTIFFRNWPELQSIHIKNLFATVFIYLSIFGSIDIVYVNAFYFRIIITQDLCGKIMYLTFQFNTQYIHWKTNGNLEFG